MITVEKFTGKKLSLTDLKGEYSSIKEEIGQAIKRVLESGYYILGKEVENFEQEFAEFLGIKFAVGVASGTDALTISIKTLGVKENEGVIVPANVYPTAFGVSLSGVKLQLADVNLNSLNVSVKTLEKAIDNNTRAIVVVHLYGNPAEIAKIAEFAKERGLYLIEDCAQASGAIHAGKRVGTFGDISCFSFYPTKNLGAYGDGGMLVTNNKNLAKRAKILRMYGEEERYKSVEVGHNSRLDEIQAAILRVKLPYLDIWNRKRQLLANSYVENLDGLPVTVLNRNNIFESVHHLFPILVKDRDKLKEFLDAQAVGTGIHYPIPVHLTPSFENLGYKEGNFPTSELASNHILSLPMHPNMTQESIEYIAQLVKSYF